MDVTEEDRYAIAHLEAVLEEKEIEGEEWTLTAQECNFLQRVIMLIQKQLEQQIPEESVLGEAIRRLENELAGTGDPKEDLDVLCAALEYFRRGEKQLEQPAEPPTGVFALAQQIARLAHQARAAGSGFTVNLSSQEALQLTNALQFYRQQSQAQLIDPGEHGMLQERMSSLGNAMCSAREILSAVLDQEPQTQSMPVAKDEILTILIPARLEPYLERMAEALCMELTEAPEVLAARVRTKAIAARQDLQVCAEQIYGLQPKSYDFALVRAWYVSLESACEMRSKARVRFVRELT